jgi:hypothetical protein
MTLVRVKLRNCNPVRSQCLQGNFVDASTSETLRLEVSDRQIRRPGAMHTESVLYSGGTLDKIILYWYGIKLLVLAVQPEREACSDLTN